MAEEQPTSGEPLEDGILEALVDAIQAPPLTDARKNALRERLFGQLDPPPPKGSYTRRALSLRWQIILPSVEVKVLHRDRASNHQTALWRLQPGAVVPAHQHVVAEECFVLEGTIRIGRHEVRQGDMHVAEPGCVHPATVSETGALLLIRSEISKPTAAP